MSILGHHPNLQSMVTKRPFHIQDQWHLCQFREIFKCRSRDCNRSSSYGYSRSGRNNCCSMTNLFRARSNGQTVCLLNYIHNDKKRCQVFVVQTILDATHPKQWRYVETRHHPADNTPPGLNGPELSRQHR